jgi:dipeptidyl aminopeptidase/acylaminoacyl peptidase
MATDRVRKSEQRKAWPTLLAMLVALTPAGALAADPSPAASATTPATATTATPTPASPPERIPTSVLGRLPFISGPKLSPDGQHIAAFVTVNNKTVVGIFDLTKGTNKLIDAGEKLDMRWFRWAGNDRLLISIGKMVSLMGEDLLQTRLVLQEISTDQMRFIGGKSEGLTGDDILWIDPAGQSILLSYAKSIFDYPSVSSIELSRNRSSEVVAAKDGVLDWYADEKGVVRAGLIFTDNIWKMFYREKDGDSFRLIAKADVKDREAGCIFYRIYQASDEGYCIMRSDGEGRDALYRYNFATRKRGDLVFEAPGVNVDDFDTKFDSPELLAAWYTDSRPRAHWFDPEMAEIQTSIDKAVASTVGERSATIVSHSRDRSRMLVHVGGSNDPGRYYVFDIGDSLMKPFAQANEKLRPTQLAATRYTRYTARDGLELPAYLTLPPGRPAKNLPLVIMPHGGPYDVRDEGTYDAELQFLANRGYAVLQPQYRGSGGYGRAFDAKGEGQWGRAMQDDLDDGMDWLAKQGTIDPQRVCIIGGSYGGYAAMWGAIRNPERYRCAASFAGVSDLKRQLRYSNKFFRSQRYKDDWRRTVQGEETFDLDTVSPLLNLERLKVPLLLVHGDDDQRVPYKQSRLMAEALAKAGKSHEFITLKGEGHGFSSDSYMQLWLDKLDAFLTRYNPAG